MLQEEIHTVEHHLEHELMYARNRIAASQRGLETKLAQLEKTLKQLVDKLGFQNEIKHSEIAVELKAAAEGKSTLQWALVAVAVVVVGLAVFAWRKYKYLTKRHFL